MTEAREWQPHMLVYREGKFTPGDPLGLAEPRDHADWGVTLSDLGYQQSQSVGETSGLSYDLWEHPGGRWIVSFQTAGLCCWIDVRTWPDLIGLLRDLSVIALAGLITDADLGDDHYPAHLPTRPAQAYPRHSPRR